MWFLKIEPDELDGPLMTTHTSWPSRWMRLILIAHLITRDGDRCWLCGGSFSAEDHCTVEHLIPRSRGGPRWYTWNTVLAHRSCNVVTGAMSLHAKFAYRDAAQTPAKMAGWIARFMPPAKAAQEKPPASSVQTKATRPGQKPGMRRPRPRRGPLSLYGPTIAPCRPKPFRVSLGDLIGRELVN